MLKKLRDMLKNNNGFTILELIVVIAIMGFLVALVAPRLVGVTESSKKPTCETNQQRLSEATERMVTERGGYPDKLRNLIPVEVDTEAGKAIVATNSTDKNNWMNHDDSKSIFSKEFVENNHLYVHKLNDGEIRALKDLGITKLIDYKTGTQKPLGNTAGTHVNEVLMVGAGASTVDNTDAIKRDPLNKNFSDPDLMYRIVLGVGEENGLMEENMMSSIGSCPTGMQHKHIDYKGYSIVLPRLKETVARLDADAKLPIKASGHDSSTISVTTRVVTTRDFKIGEAQEEFNFTVLCPEGHKTSSSDAVMWNTPPLP